MGGGESFRKMEERLILHKHRCTIKSRAITELMTENKKSFVSIENHQKIEIKARHICQTFYRSLHAAEKFTWGHSWRTYRWFANSVNELCCVSRWMNQLNNRIERAVLEKGTNGDFTHHSRRFKIDALR